MIEKLMEWIINILGTSIYPISGIAAVPLIILYKLLKKIKKN